jgi:hypothetical protein
MTILKVLSQNFTYIPEFPQISVEDGCGYSGRHISIHYADDVAY